jgi:hypothetical protein
MTSKYGLLLSVLKNMHKATLQVGVQEYIRLVKNHGRYVSISPQVEQHLEQI